MPRQEWRRRHTASRWSPSRLFFRRSPPACGSSAGQTARDQAELCRISLGWPRGADWRVRAGFLWFRLFKPLIETAGYPLALVGWILGQVDLATVLFFLVASIGSGIVVSTAAVVLPALATERGPEPAQLKRLFLAGVLENLGYRQIRNLALIVGFFRSAPPAL